MMWFTENTGIAHILILSWNYKRYEDQYIKFICDKMQELSRNEGLIVYTIFL